MLDFCYVAGFCDLLASPWSWRETSMVSWKGMLFSYPNPSNFDITCKFKGLEKVDVIW